MDDRTFLRMMYRGKLGKRLNLKEPKTFNEKLQWLKLYDREPLYTQLVDKYAVRSYVKERIGEEHLIPLLGKWDKPSDICFDDLPEKFVLKCNHDSGGLVICKDRSVLDREKTVRKLTVSYKRNGYSYGREWPYKNVQKCVIAEQYMEDETGELQDYKVHCFNGVPQFILVCSNRFGPDGVRESFYSVDWELLDVKRPNVPSSAEYERPEKLEEMLGLAGVLAQHFPFVRTDFYIINNKIYFGEMTFFPTSGFRAFEPEEWDRTFGDLLTLPPTADLK